MRSTDELPACCGSSTMGSVPCPSGSSWAQTQRWALMSSVAGNTTFDNLGLDIIALLFSSSKLLFWFGAQCDTGGPVGPLVILTVSAVKNYFDSSPPPKSSTGLRHNAAFQWSARRRWTTLQIFGPQTTTLGASFGSLVLHPAHAVLTIGCCAALLLYKLSVLICLVLCLLTCVSVSVPGGWISCCYFNVMSLQHLKDGLL